MAIDPNASRAAAATHQSMVSRTYGVKQPAVVAKIAPAAKPAAPAKTDTVSASKLVAAVVPGKVDFSAAEPTQKNTGVYSMYRRPSDRNEAATNIQVGRTIDLNG